jgi:hypothetical protein
LLIFSCFVRNVTEVNQTVVIAKFITEKWASTVVMMTPLKANHIIPQHVLLCQNHQHQYSVQEEHKKEADAKK